MWVILHILAFGFILNGDYKVKQFVGWQIKPFGKRCEAFCDRERGYSQAGQIRCLENPIKTVQRLGSLPDSWQSSPVKAEESSRFTGQSAPAASIYTHTAERKWWSVEERTSPVHISCTITPTEEFEAANYPSKRYWRVTQCVVLERDWESDGVYKSHTDQA